MPTLEVHTVSPVEMHLGLKATEEVVFISAGAANAGDAKAGEFRVPNPRARTSTGTVDGD